MHTKESLIKDLCNMGLTGEEAIMVHSSMKSIGEVAGGADTVVDAFMEFFAEGLFMTPTHTWAQMSREYDTFNPTTEPACVGIIPNVFRKREGVVRSLHATHSIAAYGKAAVKFGDADCILCEARKIFEVCEKIFAIEETCIIERKEIPEEWWK